MLFRSTMTFSGEEARPLPQRLGLGRHPAAQEALATRTSQAKVDPKSHSLAAQKVHQQAGAGARTRTRTRSCDPHLACDVRGARVSRQGTSSTFRTSIHLHTNSITSKGRRRQAHPSSPSEVLQHRHLGREGARAAREGAPGCVPVAPAEETEPARARPADARPPPEEGRAAAARGRCEGAPKGPQAAQAERARVGRGER